MCSALKLYHIRGVIESASALTDSSIISALLSLVTGSDYIRMSSRIV